MPKFKSEAEEAEFWDTHSAADYLDQLKIVRSIRFRRRKPRRIVAAAGMEKSFLKK